VQGVSFSNPLVLAVDEARRPLPGWAALLLALLVLAVSLVGGLYLYLGLAPVVAAAAGEGIAAAVADRLLQFLCIIGPMALAALAIGRLYEGRPVARGGMPAAAALALGLALGSIGFALTLGLAAGLGLIAPGEGGLMAAAGPGIAASMLLVALQAGGEELFFRGWLQPLLSARWGPWIALALTAVLFGLSHELIPVIMGAPSGPLAIVNMTLGGLVFGLLALRTGGLWAPFAAHWAWNWSELALAGATPNPGVDPLGSLFDLDLAGPALLSGGADELNGSVLVTGVMLLMALGLGLFGSPKRQKPAEIDPAKWMPILGKDPAGPARN
jgi:membrane protease YdiL (CAAX protease family)